jgi:alkylated DNA repair protein (DNA oxidative demethylase)
MADVVLQKGFLTPDEQRRVVASVLGVSPGFYEPATRWGKMHLRMNCLGRHWSARDYHYHATRVDADGLPCAPIPDDLQSLAQRALVATGYLEPHEVRSFDVCVANLYARQDGGKLGDHVDNSEGAAALSSGYPIVSLSIGAACVFRMGGLKRTDPYEKHTLESGDLVIFGRSMRLAYHGVSRLLPGATPAGLGLADGERLNLTFRVL